MPYLRPTYGNAPCAFVPPSFGDPSNPVGDRNTDEGRAVGGRSEVDEDARNEKITKKESDIPGDDIHAAESTPETKTSPKPSPWGLLAEVLGLESMSLLEERPTPPRKSLVAEVGGEDERENKRGGGDAEVLDEEHLQAIGAAGSRQTGGGGHGYGSWEREYWPHEPRYCADVWRAEGSRDDENTRYV